LKSGKRPAYNPSLASCDGFTRTEEVPLGVRVLIFASALVAATLHAGPARAGEAPGSLSIASWLDAPASEPLASSSSLRDRGLVPVGQGDAAARDYFRVPYPGRRYLTPPKIPTDWFEESFRVGVNSGLLYPLLAQTADYHIGWWARLYGQLPADLGYALFRTAVEVSLGVGQSKSSHADQDYRLSSSYTFLSFRGLLDFLPSLPADLFLFGGLGGGLEFARGHVIRTSGRVEETTGTNFNLLLEAGAGYSLEISPGFYLEARGTFLYPVGSPNVTLFTFTEIGVQFLFQ